MNTAMLHFPCPRLALTMSHRARCLIRSQLRGAALSSAILSQPHIKPVSRRLLSSLATRTAQSQSRNLRCLCDSRRHKSSAAHASETAPSTRVDGDSVVIFWPDGAIHNFYGLWLRDHCRCPECFHPQTQQRTYDTCELPLDIMPTSVQIGEAALLLTWPDGHQTSFDLQALRDAATPAPRYAKRKLWGADIAGRLPELSHKELAAGDAGVRQCLQLLRDFGFVFVKGVASSIDAIEAAVSRIAPPLDTWFGRMWTFGNLSLDHADTAYTGLPIGSHTDGTYMLSPPGLQVFQALELEGPEEGGNTTLVDGFAAAETLKAEDPDAYRILSTTAIPSQYLDPKLGLHHVALSPVLGHDPRTGELERVRINSYDRAPMTESLVGLDRARDVYRALHRFEHILRRPESVFQTRLQPGNMLILDNWRVLHGRTAVHPQARRMLGGCYVSRDDFTSALRKNNLLI